MKKVLSIVAVVALAASFTACKKCAQCTYDANGFSYDTGEFCGKPGEVKDAVAQLESAGYTCN